MNVSSIRARSRPLRRHVIFSQAGLIDYAYAPTMSFPAGTLMIEPSESESKQRNRFCDDDRDPARSPRSSSGAGTEASPPPCPHRARHRLHCWARACGRAEAASPRTRDQTIRCPSDAWTMSWRS
jgi:glycine cleavage system protein P-like pyridoxal-binding family